MSQPDACPLPSDATGAQATTITRLLNLSNIAVVGLSDDPARPSHAIAAYLQSHGYQITPVNPQIRGALGERAVNSLADLPAPPEVVLVFRRPEFCAQIAQDAVAARAKGLWLQAGIRSADAARIAREAGLEFIEDRCMMVEHMHAMKA